MIARIVKIKCIYGMEKQLTQMGQNKLVPINKEGGCLEVYFLEPSLEDKNPYFGVISIWQDEKKLNSLKTSEKYRSLQNDLSPFIESVTEDIFVISTD